MTDRDIVEWLTPEELQNLRERCEDFSMPTVDGTLHRQLVDMNHQRGRLLDHVDGQTAEIESLRKAAMAEAEAGVELRKRVKELEEERANILREVCRLQPEGSPCPGGPTMRVAWIIKTAQDRIATLERQLLEWQERAADLASIVDRRTRK